MTDKDFRFQISCFYSEDDGQWVAEDAYTGANALAGTPYQALDSLVGILPDVYEIMDEDAEAS